MSSQDLDAFMNLVRSDALLREQLVACQSPKEAQAVVEAAGFSFSVDELLQMRSGLAIGELDDAALENVAGAGDTKSCGRCG